MLLFACVSVRRFCRTTFPSLCTFNLFSDISSSAPPRISATRFVNFALMMSLCDSTDVEGMLTDMNVSKDSQNNFSQWMRNNEINLGMDCSVTVLTTGFWPTYKVDEVALPNELVKCVDKFTQFYESRTSHRKLKWIHTLGTCNLVGRFDAKPIELVISTYQACILMLFNQQTEYTTADIASATKLPMDELKKYLNTLALSK